MKYKQWTMIFVGVLVLAILIFDVFVLYKGGTEASISHLLIVWAYKYPIMPFFVGIICGHLFWRMRQTKSLSEHPETINKEEK